MSKAAASRHFGCSKTLITRKFQQGKLVTVGDLIDVVASKGAFGGNGKPVTDVNSDVDAAVIGQEPLPFEDFAAAQRRKESALANLRELEYREKTGELVDVGEMERAWAEATQTFRDGLLSFPELVAPGLAALTDARQIRDVLKTAVRNVLSNLPDKIRNVASDQQAA